MLLTAWSDEEQMEYIRRRQLLLPDEIQLNTPTRPRPLVHQLEARGNHPPNTVAFPTRSLKQVNAEVLECFVDRIQKATGIIARYPLLQEQEIEQSID